MKRNLNAWEVLALEKAIRFAVDKGLIHGYSGRRLAEEILYAKTITLSDSCNLTREV